MNIRLILTVVFCSAFLQLSFSQSTTPKIEGKLKKWHKITLSFEGKQSSENDADNPFLNYRLNATFKKGDKTYLVPGFYAADGNAAETSSKSGNIWQVRFSPDELGIWTYEVSFRKGKNIAVSTKDNEGEPTDFDGASGQFEVGDADGKGSAFQSQGRLSYTGDRYLHYSDSNKPFLKGGADSPENFLAYYEFDDTPGTHKYLPHTKDWTRKDPTWQKSKGKNIIGALNYLSSKGMNSVYFLTMNVMGDGDDVWPWINQNERTRFDCSKLDQWEVVFDHMDNLGLMLHIVTQETENELLLDIGETGLLRKLYYRELIARFSHHLGVTWNLGEENGPIHFSPKGQNDDDRKAMAKYIKETDPYKNLIVVHTHPKPEQQQKVLSPLLGYKHLNGISFQTHHSDMVHEITNHWLQKSRKSGNNWVLSQDEIGPAGIGAKPDADDPDHDEMRHKVLWGNLMAGGAGVEWYFGYKFTNNDLNSEDWRSRDALWDQTRFALDFFNNHVNFEEMQPADGLTDNKDAYVLAKMDQTYVIYLPKAAETHINMFGTTGSYSVKWFNPRTGEDLTTGTIKAIMGGKEKTSIGFPPNNEGDWVALIELEDKTTKPQDRKKETSSLTALNDFQLIDSKNGVTYYKDKNNKALAIDASKETHRDRYARAVTKFKKASGFYKVILMTSAENDGESKYIISINGKTMDTIVNPETEDSFKLVRHEVGSYYLAPNDLIQIASKAVTNGKIPENGGTAWSRGRWNSLTLIPEGLSVKEQIRDSVAFEEKNGFLEVEAEAFHFRSNNGTNRDWYIRSKESTDNLPTADSTDHTRTASNTAYIESLPDTRVTHDDDLIEGENFFPVAGVGGIVSYKVNVTNPGKYYIWGRAYSSGPEDNGIHVGIDGKWPEDGARMQWCDGKNEWTWSSAQRVPDNHCGTPKTIYLNIDKPGEHIISFSMREDGFELDKWIMTQNADLIPKP
ncbi:MAG: DUF5060 domain-containing protein [Leeuwenhoekiella sp.]